LIFFKCLIFVIIMTPTIGNTNDKFWFGLKINVTNQIILSSIKVFQNMNDYIRINNLCNYFFN
jgi:hypothetical protein